MNITTLTLGTAIVSLSTVFQACVGIDKSNSQTATSTQHALEVSTFTSGEAGFSVNSHLIFGKKDAVLIDAQFTRSEATKLSQWIKDSGKELNTIVVSHAHPDHYLGLEILTKQFPSAKIVAQKDVVADIQATAQGKLDFWKPIYKDDLADSFVIPKILQENRITLEGQTIDLESIVGAESDNETIFRIPSADAVLTGDLLYSGVHLWLAEHRAMEWKQALNTLRTKVGPKTKLFPGHGAPKGIELITENTDYIEVFLKAVGSSNTSEDAANKVKSAYPNYLLPIIVDTSMKSYLK